MVKNPNAFVKCPYYRRRRYEKIFCEGIHGAEHSELVFSSSIKVDGHMQRYCANGRDPMCYKQCAIASRLEEEYYDD